MTERKNVNFSKKFQMQKKKMLLFLYFSLLVLCNLQKQVIRF